MSNKLVIITVNLQSGKIRIPKIKTNRSRFNIKKNNYI